jgi:hypothetical protein
VNVKEGKIINKLAIESKVINRTHRTEHAESQERKEEISSIALISTTFLVLLFPRGQLQSTIAFFLLVEPLDVSIFDDD